MTTPADTTVATAPTATAAPALPVVAPNMPTLPTPRPIPPAAPTATAPQPTAPLTPEPTALVAAIAPKPEPTAAPAMAAAPAPARITAIGDSVMVGASPALVAAIPEIEIEAAVSTQASQAVDIVRRKAEAGELGDIVVIHMGTNGTFTAQQFDEMMTILGTRRVFFVNVKVPRPWEGPNNAMLAENVPRYPNASLIDWNAAISAQPALLWTDGVHLRPPAGNELYADTVAAAVRGG